MDGRRDRAGAGTWVERAATEFDGWLGSGAHSTWSEVEQAMARFRSHGGRRAVLVSVVADLGQTGPAGPDTPVDLRCPLDEARRRLERLAGMGFDDVVLMSANRDPSHIDALAELTRAPS